MEYNVLKFYESQNIIKGKYIDATIQENLTNKNHLLFLFLFFLFNRTTRKYTLKALKIEPTVVIIIKIYVH